MKPRKHTSWQRNGTKRRSGQLQRISTSLGLVALSGCITGVDDPGPSQVSTIDAGESPSEAAPAAPAFECPTQSFYDRNCTQIGQTCEVSGGASPVLMECTPHSDGARWELVCPEEPPEHLGPCVFGPYFYRDRPGLAGYRVPDRGCHVEEQAASFKCESTTSGMKWYVLAGPCPRQMPSAGSPCVARQAACAYFPEATVRSEFWCTDEGINGWGRSDFAVSLPVCQPPSSVRPLSTCTAAETVRCEATLGAQTSAEQVGRSLGDLLSSDCLPCRFNGPPEIHLPVRVDGNCVSALDLPLPDWSAAGYTLEEQAAMLTCIEDKLQQVAIDCPLEFECLEIALWKQCLLPR